MQQITDQGMRRGVSSSLVGYLYLYGETPPVSYETVSNYEDNSITLTATPKSELLNKIKGED